MSNKSNYAEIFEYRGVKYDDAMRQFPSARDQEFGTALSFIDFDSVSVVCDIPSGGGYLRRFLNKDISLVCVEESDDFYELCPVSSNTTRLKGSLDSVLPVETDLADVIFSIAGLHHLQDKRNIVNEFYRITKPTGEVVIADVSLACITAPWLNVFVHENNSVGHDGIFLDKHFDQMVEEAGFSVLFNKIVRYDWVFESELSMVKFCRSLFGIDLCSDEDILEGIKKYLGYRIGDDLVRMNWELKFMHVKK